MIVIILILILKTYESLSVKNASIALSIYKILA